MPHIALFSIYLPLKKSSLYSPQSLFLYFPFNYLQSGFLCHHTTQMFLSKVSSHLQLTFPSGSAGKESTCNAGDLGWIPGIDPWVGKIPWRRESLPTPVFWRPDQGLHLHPLNWKAKPQLPDHQGSPSL